MKSKSLLLTIILGMGLLANSGCVLLVGGAAGAGAVAYLGGELKSDEEISLDRLWDATQAAIKDMGLTVKTKEKDYLSAKLVAVTADDKNININLKRKSDNLTEIAIRIGKFGNESMSQQILNEIKNHY
ncbi:MAG: DUF3568 family protein [Thermoplasmata archaeon]|nr:MAG: DUF3568 family protein [Thermoplasmata archaeon]